MDDHGPTDSSLDSFARDKLAALEAADLRRTLIETDRTDAVEVIRAGRRLISFCCNDYLNLTHHPDVKRAAQDAIDRFGTGAGASRLVSGNHSLLSELEGKLARLKGTDAALVFSSGYLANIGTIPALAGPPDLIVMDALVHSCIHAGARLSGAQVEIFPHNDVDACRAVLEMMRAPHERCLILTETVFSMDGDRAPIALLADIARDYDAWLMTDDAHGLGLVPSDSPDDVPVQMGTLSKTAGSMGGYVCASRLVIDLLINRARSFIYTTGLAPSAAAAASAALDVMAREPERGTQAHAHARDFAARLGLPEPESAIVPVILEDSERALAASRQLEEQGFLVTAIRPPTVPAGTARLRVTFTAGHTDAMVSALAGAIGRL
jgi:8-amino-7-oxononanoate synthase